MEVVGGSGQERGLGKAATVAPGAAALAAPIRTASHAAYPAEVSPRIPRQGLTLPI
jgi:hypothetical protein